MRKLVFLLLLSFGMQWTCATAASKDDAAWKVLRERYPDQIAIHDAVPYSETYHPDIYAAYRSHLSEIEALRRRFVEIVLDTHRCDAIEQVGVDPSQQEGSRLRFWLDCVDGTWLKADEQAIRAGQISQQEELTEREAVATCKQLFLANQAVGVPKWKIVVTDVQHEQGRMDTVTLWFKGAMRRDNRPQAKARCEFPSNTPPRIRVEHIGG